MKNEITILGVNDILHNGNLIMISTTGSSSTEQVDETLTMDGLVEYAKKKRYELERCRFVLVGGTEEISVQDNRVTK